MMLSLQTILIVDDEPANLAIMREILHGSYRLVFARNGSEALAAMAKHLPAMVLLDIGLPDISGYDLCRKIRELDGSNQVKVIFITAYTDIAHEAAGFDAGGVDYITKPVSPQIVRARVNAHLSLVRATALEQSYHDPDAGSRRALQRQRYRLAYLAHGGVCRHAGTRLWLERRAKSASRIGRADARHRQAWHPARDFAQARTA
jgi:DNA-binding response OmpR family regulator